MQQLGLKGSSVLSFRNTTKLSNHTSKGFSISKQTRFFFGCNFPFCYRNPRTEGSSHFHTLRWSPKFSRIEANRWKSPRKWRVKSWAKSRCQFRSKFFKIGAEFHLYNLQQKAWSRKWSLSSSDHVPLHGKYFYNFLRSLSNAQCIIWIIMRSSSP